MLRISNILDAVVCTPLLNSARIGSGAEAVKVLVYPESVDHMSQEQGRFDERREAEEEVAAAVEVEAPSPGRHP